MTGLLYICNILFAAGQVAFGKQAAHRGGTAQSFNLNKAIIGVILFLLIGLFGGFSFHLPTILFGMVYGLALCLSMHAGFQAVATGPMALSSIIASFSLIIPVLFGIFLWNEAVTFSKILGLALLLFSIFLINCKKEAGFSLQWLISALTTLVANGVCSVILKLHQTQFPTLYRTEFMFWALLSVLFILSGIALCNREKQSRFQFSLLGLLSGAMNCFANYIVLYLSATENASVLFPIISIANSAAVWLIGLLFFKERLKLIPFLGFITGIISVLLLKL